MLNQQTNNMEALLIDKITLSEYWPLSKNMNNNRVDPHILRAQQKQLKPFLGEALYYDLVTNPETGNYPDLIDGTEYEYGGNTIFFNGLKPLLAAWAYAGMIKENPLHINRAGNKNKDEENSVEIAAATIAIKSNEAKSEAVRLQDETQRFLDTMRANYPLWGKGHNINTPTKQGVSFTRVPRHIQR